MPKIMDCNAEGEMVERYRWLAIYGTPIPGMDDALIQWRKDAIKDQEEFLGYQKACGRKDRDAARFFSECAKHNLKLQRACTFILPWIGGGDGKVVAPSLWPVDLAPELDEISVRLQLLGSTPR